MAKSTTGKKFNLDLEKAQETFSEVGTQYLTHWTKKELLKFRTEPVVIPYGKYGFLIGNFKVEGVTKDCWKVSKIDDKKIHDFVSKQNAIVYCLYEVSQKFEKANEVKSLDEKIGRLTNDITCYQNSMTITKDKFKNSVTLNRYIDAKLHLSFAVNNLKKTLKMAKYMNFGNQVI